MNTLLLALGVILIPLGAVCLIVSPIAGIFGIACGIFVIYASAKNEKKKIAEKLKYSAENSKLYLRPTTTTTALNISRIKVKRLSWENLHFINSPLPPRGIKKAPLLRGLLHILPD